MRHESTTTIDHEVIVIGAGFGGICTGIKLREAGIHDFVILEKAGGVGGTWRHNTYPGVGVDIPSFTYSFSFEKNPYWSRSYAKGPELMAYAEHCAEKYGLRPHLRLNTEVLAARFDEAHDVWTVHTANDRRLTCRFLMVAPGAFSTPKLPDIEGLDTFGGPVLHTAKWDHRVDLAGKRVAVIGTGASSVQVIPTIAGTVRHQKVFQRTPIWVIPKPDFPLPATLQRAYDRLPLTQSTTRQVSNGFVELALVAGVMFNKQLPFLVQGIESFARLYLKYAVDDPVTQDKLTPAYSYGCKRPSFSNSYYQTFNRDDVELITTGIDRITEAGIRTADGAVHEVDVIIAATGFKVFEFGNTPPFPLYGRDGAELGKFWDEHRYQAYEGTTGPGWPNVFAITGPYSITGSYFLMAENTSHHAIRCIREARKRGATRVEIKAEPHIKYFNSILRRQRSTLFYNAVCGGANSYYFDRHGDAPMLRPTTSPEAWFMARFFPLDDYEYTSDSGTRLAGGRNHGKQVIPPSIESIANKVSAAIDIVLAPRGDRNTKVA